MSSSLNPTASALSPLDVNRWFPSTYDRGPNWLVWLALTSSFIAVFIKLWTPISINRIPEALYTLPFFYALYKNFYWLKKDRIIQLFGLAILLPIVFFGINYLRDPITALEYESMDKLAKLFFFVPIAWWLGGNARTIDWFLAVAFAGLLIACLHDPNLARTLSWLLNGRRIDFSILNAQHVALYFAVALIGLLSIASSALGGMKSIKTVWKPLVWIASLAICVAVVLGTQTRATWLALVVCAACWVIQLAWQYRDRKPGGKFFVSVVLLAAFAGLAGYQFSDTVVKRVKSEQGTVSHIISGDWENIPYTSIGLRINTWIEATKWIADKPITGWGGNVRKDVITQSERLPDKVKNQFGHFHNSYIEFSLAYGLAGLLVILWTFFHLLRNTIRPGSDMPKWIRSFSFYSIVLFLVMNLFESYIFFWSGVFVASIILAPSYSLILKRTAQK